MFKKTRKFHAHLVLILVLLGSALIVTPAHAATITVNVFTDEDTDNTNCSLREAIIAANTNAVYRGCSAGAGSDDITLPAGTFTLTLGKQLPVVTSSMTINGNSRTDTFVQASTCDPVTLPGGCTPATYRVLEVGGGGSLTINNLTIRHGNCPNSLLCTISSGDQDSNKGKGGGIFNSGILMLSNSTMSRNKATNDGGGIYLYQGSLSITDTDIVDNAAGTGGGGAASSGSGTINVMNSVFGRNTAGNGGGISTSGGTLNVMGSTFANNSASGGDGGGINSGGTLTVDKSSIHDNTAGNRGGGIGSTGGGPNSVTNSTISSNTASSKGGGIFNYDDLNVTNSTLTGNSAAAGGGFYSDPYQHENDTKYAVVTLKNTILANSTSGGDCYNYVNGPEKPITGNNNLIETEGISPCGTTAPITNTDPNLGTLTGSPAFYPLNAGSPAIDAGDDATCAAQPVSNTSQNGVTRPQGLHCDIGAYEKTLSGTITVKKLTVPAGSDQAFAFTGAITAQLKHGQSATETVEPGSYSVSETVPTGWQLTSIQCDDSDSAGDASTGEVIFRVLAGEDVTCTFTNTQGGVKPDHMIYLPMMHQGPKPKPE